MLAARSLISGTCFGFSHDCATQEMAISMASVASAISVVPRTSLSCSSLNSELAQFSSLRFSDELRISGFRKHGLTFKQRRRTLTLVASNKQTFSSLDELLEKADKPVLVDFYATWCGPCQFMVPILEQVSANLVDKIQVVKIDTEKYPAIANKYQIEALPTFILFKNGEPFDRFEGALAADLLIKRIESSLQVKQ